MFKKIVISLLAVTVLAVPAQSICFAEDVPAFVTRETIVAPRFANIQSFDTDLRIEDGIAKCNVTYRLSNTNYTASCQIILESSSNKTSWSRVTSWTESGRYLAMYDKEKTLPTPLAKYYRVRSVLTVYNTSGTQVEKVEAISNIV